MIVFEDTRNQVGKHKAINDSLNTMGIPVHRTKLFVGDYTRLDNMTVCIDTKQDWVEVAGNICGKQHERFRNECLRAQHAGIKLVVLVEEEMPIEQWESPKRRNGTLICHVSKAILMKAMLTMAEKYGVEFVNCAKSETAKKIVQILSMSEKKIQTEDKLQWEL